MFEINLLNCKKLIIVLVFNIITQTHTFHKLFPQLGKLHILVKLQTLKNL